MILTENRDLLRVKNRKLLDVLSQKESTGFSGNVVVEEAKNGMQTAKMHIDSKTLYIHSKYDPEKEANQFIDIIANEETKHVLFVGVGLGYHINAYMEEHPQVTFSIYEPNEEVLYAYLANKQLDVLPLKKLNRIFTGNDSEIFMQEVQKVLATANGSLQIIALPVFEKIYAKQLDLIRGKLIESLKNKRLSLVVNLSFQQRWTVNSIKNFPTLLKTPNILNDFDSEIFAGKPAIIVAAGPSLNEEIEHLRYIKENGLAYIFSVGSAINSLIEHGIHPDAACVYDPSEGQYLVTKKVVDENITDITLIYGSSVGFETLEKYPGKMLHMITSQDTVSPHLLDTTKDIEVVFDAPSIAVIAFQMLLKLKASPIVFVGQNLGYQDNKRYASGINYDFVDNDVTQVELKESETVEDVYGNLMQTNEGFIRMREQLEMYVSKKGDIEVINTTRGGANIKGTTFQHLNELINNKLRSPVVNKNWFDQSNTYDLEFTMAKLVKLTNSEKQCAKYLNNALDELSIIYKAFEYKQTKNMEKRFLSFDKEFNKLKRNTFYIAFLEPMLKVQNEQLSENSLAIRFEADILKKAERVVQSFESFIKEVQMNMEYVKPLVAEMKTRIEKVQQ